MRSQRDFGVVEARGNVRVRRPDADGSEKGSQRLSCMDLPHDGRCLGLWKREMYKVVGVLSLDIDFELVVR